MSKENLSGVATAIASALPQFSSPADGAKFWYQFGFKVIPIYPAIKVTAVKWDAWLNDLSVEAVNKYWQTHPVHEVGFIVGDDNIVFDADSPAAVEVLVKLEQVHGVTPNMVMQTSKGEHHHFRRAPGTVAKSDSHSTVQYPDRIDIKTGRAMVILSPSKGKVIKTFSAQSADELAIVGQGFIDAVFAHNGRSAPSKIDPVANHCDDYEPLPGIMTMLTALVNKVDPDSGYEDWLHVGMAIYQESGGSDEGLALFDSWSQRGSKYGGVKDIETKWRSFKSSTGNPITIATIKMMVEQAGFDWLEVCAAAEPRFEVCEGETIGNVVVDEVYASSSPFEKYSLRGKADLIAAEAQEQVQIMDELAIKGQATVWYAAPNTGKTLLAFALLIKSIKSGRINPAQLFYLDMDDTAHGLATKLRIADEYGFHILAEGYLGFTVTNFLNLLREVIESNRAAGMVVVLDTLTKFADLMDKGSARKFTTVAREFVVKGGSIIALAHANKNPGRNGKPTYGGVSDILNDLDCAYIISTIESGGHGKDKVIHFENIKKRGNVALTAAYSYSAQRDVSYEALLASVDHVDDLQIESLIQEAQTKSDAELIAIISACIGEGINTKMKLVDAVAERAKVSKRIAIQTIERYAGCDPLLHRWAFSVKERGAKVFELHQMAAPLTDDTTAG